MSYSSFVTIINANSYITNFWLDQFLHISRNLYFNNLNCMRLKIQSNNTIVTIIHNNRQLYNLSPNFQLPIYMLMKKILGLCYSVNVK